MTRSGRTPRLRVRCALAAALTAACAVAAPVGASAWGAPRTGGQNATASGQAPGGSRGPGSLSLATIESAIPSHYVASAPHIPSGSVRLGPLATSTVLNIDVVMLPADHQKLALFVQALYNPSSPFFHKFLAPGQFAQQYGPTSQAVSTVRSTLARDGMTVAPAVNGSVLSVQTTVGLAESVFNTPIAQYRRHDGSTFFANTVAPTIPSAIKPYVTSVVGLDNSVVFQSSIASRPSGVSQSGRQSVPATSRSPHATGPQPCAIASSLNTQFSGAGRVGFTADQLASMYGFTSAYTTGHLGAGQTIAVFELEPFLVSDISAYEQCYGIHPSITIKPVDNGAGSGSGTGEAALDIEVAMGLAPQANIAVYEAANAGTGYFDEENQIVTDDSASVISTSWGACEPDLSSATIQTESLFFTQAATQGQTWMADAFDSGSEACFSPLNNPGGTGLAVEDPASQPFATGVGGTTITTFASPPRETVWNFCQGFSSTTPSQATSCALGSKTEVNGQAGGGGKSIFNSLPSYQSGAGIGGTAREVPDISADADPLSGYVIFFSGSWQIFGGTSAATPLWAAFVELSNTECTTNTGFANPALYRLFKSTPSDFNDINVLGANNDFTGTNSGQFTDAAGYDMASGIGTPTAALLSSAGLCNVPPSPSPPTISSSCPYPQLACPGVIPDAGPTTGGTRVTITGTGFTGATAVNFGFVPATTFTVISATKIIAISPGNLPGPTDVQVVTPNGTSAISSADKFFYGSGPIVNSINPTTGPTSGGTTVTVTGTGFTGVTSVTFGTTAATSFFVVSSTQITAVTPAEPASTVDTIVTANGSVSPAAPLDQFTFTTSAVFLSITPPTGLVTGGTHLTISGFNFTNVTNVDIGSAPASTFTVISPTQIVAVTPPSPITGPVSVVLVTSAGFSENTPADIFNYVGCTQGNDHAEVSAITPMENAQGYWLSDRAGRITSCGTIPDAQYFGSPDDPGGYGSYNAPTQFPTVGIAGTQDGLGYWTASADGAVFAYGLDASYFGSAGSTLLTSPVIGIASTPDGGGYWLGQSNGGVLAFGDATFLGSMAGTALRSPVVGIAATSDGKGYWLVGADGGVFAFGDAGYLGSMGGVALTQPVVAIVPTPLASGYWLVGADGGVFAYGSAPYLGSGYTLRSVGLNVETPIVGMAATQDGGGYWLAASSGTVYNFGDAVLEGQMNL